MNPALRWCPEDTPCDNKDCATTKYERCRLIELQEPERFWYFCQCVGELIDCCQDLDCPGAAGNPCIQCIMPAGEPEEARPAEEVFDERGLFDTLVVVAAAGIALTAALAFRRIFRFG